MNSETFPSHDRQAPAGGALFENLANLEGQRAGKLATGAGSIAQDQLNQAFGLVGGNQTGTSLNSLAQGNQLNLQLAQLAAQQEAAEQNQFQQMLATGIGALGLFI